MRTSSNVGTKMRLRKRVLLRLIPAWRRLVLLMEHAFSALVLVSCFPALSTGCMMFSGAWHRLFFFPVLGCTFWRTGDRFYVFPHLAPVVCFPALGTGCMFSRAWQRFCFHALKVIPQYCIAHPYCARFLRH